MLMEHIEQLPRTIDVKGGNGHAYLMLGVLHDGWVCGYVDWRGFPVRKYKTFGRSANEAVLNMKELFADEQHLQDLFDAPTIKVDEDSAL